MRLHSWNKEINTDQCAWIRLRQQYPHQIWQSSDLCICERKAATLARWLPLPAQQLSLEKRRHPHTGHSWEPEFTASFLWQELGNVAVINQAKSDRNRAVGGKGEPPGLQPWKAKAAASGLTPPPRSWHYGSWSGRARPYLVIFASLPQALPGLQSAAEAAVVGLLLVNLLLVRVHQEQEVRIALLQTPAGHFGTLDLALQLGHLLLKQDVARGDAPVVEGEDRDHYQQHHQHEGGQAAAPPVSPETHHGDEPGCARGPQRRHLPAEAQACAELPGGRGPRASGGSRRASALVV